MEKEELEQDGAAKGVVQRSQVSFHLRRYDAEQLTAIGA